MSGDGKICIGDEFETTVAASSGTEIEVKIDGVVVPSTTEADGPGMFKVKVTGGNVRPVGGNLEVFVNGSAVKCFKIVAC